MSLPSGELPRPKRKAPARTPSSLPSLSLPLRLGRVREIITSHTSTPSPSRPGSSGAQSTTESHTEPDNRNITNNFPDLVYDILQRARTVPDTPERLLNETSHIPHVQIEGSKIWKEFQSHAAILEKDLQKFQDSVQELGSSLELFQSARAVRENLYLISQLFQENARKLFPRALIPQRLSRTGTRYSRRRPNVNAPFNADLNAEDKPFHLELKSLAEGVGRLRLALEQFPDFNNIEVWPLISFEAVLNHWSSILESYQDQLESRELRSYIHELSKELGTQFEETSLYLREIIDGVPTARLSQKHAISTLQTLATISTFFSAVTATTIQYSFENNDTRVDKAVNLFWLTSLVCSIASALNSFLVLTWRRANYTRLRIPWWLWIWIRQCPTVFLVVSVVAFLAGLGCFTVSRQPLFTSIIVIISEVTSAFGLAAVLVWLAYDKWTFYRSKELSKPEFPVVRENLDSILPLTIEHKPSWYIPSKAVRSGLIAESTFSLTRTVTEQSSGLTPGQRSERARQRWRRAVKNVMLVSKALRVERGREVLESLHMDALDPRLRKLVISDELPRIEAGKDTSDIQFDPLGKSLAICGRGLSMRYELSTTKKSSFPHYMGGGQARQMVWASSGYYLITRAIQAIYVWDLRDPIANRSVIIRKEISRYILGIPSKLENTPKFISIEGARRNKLAIIEVGGQETMVHDFENTIIEHLDIGPHGTRVIIAASITGDVERMQPVNTSLSHKLMVFNLRTRQVEHQVPLWHNAQYVTISESGKWVVVTYTDYSPPQLWHLHRTPSGVELVLHRQFCARDRGSAHEFDPLHRIKFSGRGHFVYNDRYVMCATTDGKIHIWRRDKADPVHIHDRLTLDKDKPVQIACNKASNDFMFATRSHNGSVRIWKIQDPPTIQINTPGVSGHEQSNTGNPGRFISRGPVTESPQSEKPSGSEIGHESEE